ncbi:nitrilase-related carbon-nitrogen hydrolase [Pedococcus sp. NPDC057267]|uniref:nitrilase-related carbon-nitrogen hydrolase n=1 Tax=Pedococcus sp. NPDC057267 TaxID=3346077 RepID=UPI00363F240B
MDQVTVALTQAFWTGDKDSMIDKHVALMREASEAGANIICFQELFYGPYFGIVQDPKYYDYAESVPGPTTDRFAALARELSMVVVLPVYEEEQTGVLYNTAAVIDADGRYLGKYRKNHIPHLDRFWEKFYFKPGNLGWPVFDTAVGRVGLTICYDRHFPEGWRSLGLGGAEIVFNPNASKPGQSNRLWELEQPAAAGDNGYFVCVPNRVGRETNEFGQAAVDFYGTSYVVDPMGNFVGEKASSTDEELLIRQLDMTMIRRTRYDWQFYRDRRPDTYAPISAP